MTQDILAMALDFDDVRIVPQPSTIRSRQEVEVLTNFVLPTGRKIDAIPIIVANLDATGTIKMARTMTSCGAFTCLSKYVDIEEACSFISSMGRAGMNLTFLTVGPNEIDRHIDEISRQMELHPILAEMSICLDAANGYSVLFIEALKKLRMSFPHAWIMAGNVCTGRGAIDIAMAGANIVKVGIGSGGLCTTRDVTGVGVPQISAVLDCYGELLDINGSRVYICSDGGIDITGNASKAFVAGADMVMCGSFFAGTNECDMIDVVEKKTGGRFGIAYGSASEEARKAHGKSNNDYSTAEGTVDSFYMNGESARTRLGELLGGIRSACAYVGARNIATLHSVGAFVRVTREY